MLEQTYLDIARTFVSQRASAPLEERTEDQTLLSLPASPMAVPEVSEVPELNGSACEKSERSEEREREVAWRAAAMLPQVPRTGAIPVLVARRLAPGASGCISCGGVLTASELYRCPWCAAAVRRVLAEVREGVEPTREPLSAD
ncbi:MAG: hypothetical protein AVDCRST_MAG77-4828 [uncultured Chloroflexi bacterium]|uniref:Uncharacterized protein n=1 Tax=uncultured Chloroflexota bacterium TaxID=166587 RepID=A0A6J4K0H6_9CHLR|nr:MAG: hypothetical protein AVDCRST_MAG77-4828 [uncultured Chloroflexota bacterium]